MADLPYPITGDTVEELVKQTFDVFRDLYYDRIGGAMVGDVFTNESDVLELNVAEGSGLFKNDDGELDFNATASSISNVPSGGIESTTVQNAINELSAGKMQIDGIPIFEKVVIAELPTGSAPSTVSGKVTIFSYDTPGWDQTVYAYFYSSVLHALCHEV